MEGPQQSAEEEAVFQRVQAIARAAAIEEQKKREGGDDDDDGRVEFASLAARMVRRLANRERRSRSDHAPN